MGVKNALLITWQYPVIILTPVYSPWTIGPFNVMPAGSCFSAFSFKGKKIGVTFFHTWINVYITSAGVTVQLALSFLYVEHGFVDWMLLLYYLFPIVTSLYFFGILPIIHLQYDKCWIDMIFITIGYLCLLPLNVILWWLSSQEQDGFSHWPIIFTTINVCFMFAGTLTFILSWLLKKCHPLTNFTVLDIDNPEQDPQELHQLRSQREFEWSCNETQKVKILSYKKQTNFDA